MTKPLRKRLIILGAVMVAVTAMIAFWLEGWRLFGFQYCTSFELIDMEATMIDETRLGIIVSCRSNGIRMKDYVYEIEDGTLKIGFKFGLFAEGGMINQFILPLDQPVNKILFCSGKEETEIPIQYLKEK